MLIHLLLKPSASAYRISASPNTNKVPWSVPIVSLKDLLWSNPLQGMPVKDFLWFNPLQGILVKDFLWFNPLQGMPVKDFFGFNPLQENKKLLKGYILFFKQKTIIMTRKVYVLPGFRRCMCYSPAIYFNIVAADKEYQQGAGRRGNGFKLTAFRLVRENTAGRGSRSTCYNIYKA